MNLYLKYGPLLYTYYTRWKTLKFAFMCLFMDIGFGSVSILYFYLNGDISLYTGLSAILLFVLLFYLFSVFYEIGYIHNDLFVIKREKKPTIRVEGTVSNKFAIYQMIIRVLIGGVFTWLLFIFDSKLAILFGIITLATILIFFVHNLIRNYFWNFITFFLLRFMKFSLVIPVIYFCIGTFDSPIYLYLVFLFVLMQFGANINVYNKYYGGNSKYPQGLMFFYWVIASIILYFFSKDNLFILYSVIYLIFFIVKTPKNYFTLKDNR